MSKFYLLLYLFFCLVSCGSDDPESEIEMPECGGEITITVDGVSESFRTPFSATFANVALDSASELLIVWMDGSKSVNCQVVTDGAGLDCFPTGRINLKSLPSNVSVLGFQYFDVPGILASVSNVFIEDGGDGWIDIKSCDGVNEIISVEFEFDAVNTNGDLIKIRGGNSQDICFERTK